MKSINGSGFRLLVAFTFKVAIIFLTWFPMFGILRQDVLVTNYAA